MTFWIIVKVLLLGVALFSFLAYKSRRGDNADALAQLRQTPVLRTLTPDETLALEPLRIAGGLAWGEQVHALQGGFSRHGLDVNGSETLHDTLGNVDVVLPYDALAFLQEHNDAEVVLSAKQAIVVRLNGFTIVQGRARSLQQGAAAGDDPDLPPPLPASDGDTAPQPELHAPASPVQVLQQRQETAEEAALRQPGSRGLVVAGLWVLAFGLMLLAAVADLGGARLPILLGALCVAGLAVWWEWRRASAVAQPVAVNRVQGHLRQVELPNPVNAALRNHHYFLGDALQVHPPAHWQRSGRLPLGQPVQMDIIASDGQVLAMGRDWSQADEARRFPARRWGHHLILLIIALLALLVAVLCSDGIGRDLSLAWQGLRGGETRSDTTPAALVQRPPRSGDRVKLRGQGQCELALTDLQDLDVAVVLPDCSRIRWGGQPVALPALQMPAAWLSLYRGDYVSAREDNVSALMQMLMMQQAGSDPYAQAALAAQGRSEKLVNGMGHMVEVVEQACTAGMQDCEALQRDIVRQLGASANVEGQDVELDSWALLARELRRAAEDGNDSMLLPSGQLNALQDTTRRYAGAAIALQMQQLAPQLLALQRGGVVLATPHDLRGNTEDAPADAPGVRAGTVLDRWEQAMTTLATPVPFALEGLVVDRHEDAGGLRLQVDTDADDGRIVAAAASSLWFLLALLLAITQAVLLWRGIVAARARRHALDADMRVRPAPGLAG